MQPEHVLSVTELTREIRDVLQGHIGTVWVEGEISNHRLQSSGHQYFTLKDAGSQLSCVMFRGAARSGVRLTDGVQVQVHGEISVYEPRGQYQMVVKQVQMKGMGSLQAQFEALKRKLYEEGLFEQEYKQPIPKYPRVVALVTSPTGAAIQDMLNILTRRAPWIHVLVYPVRVQGVGVEREEDDCAGRLDCADKQSAGQAFGFAFSKSSQILSPHRPIFSIGGCCSNGAGGAVFLKIKKAPIPPTIKIIKINIVNFFIISVYQKSLLPTIRSLSFILKQ